MNYRPSFNEGFFVTRISPNPVNNFGESHFGPTPEYVMNMFGAPAINPALGHTVSDWTRWITSRDTLQDYAISAIMPRQQPNRLITGAMNSGSHQLQEQGVGPLVRITPPPNAEVQKIARYDILHDFVFDVNNLHNEREMMRYAHDIVAQVLPLVPDQVGMIDIRWMMTDALGAPIARSTGLVALSQIVRVLYNMILNVLDFYQHNLAAEGHPGVTGIRMTELTVVYQTVGNVPLGQRVVFGKIPELNVEDWIKCMSLQHGLREQLNWTDLNNFLRRYNFNLFIPQGKTNCLIECIWQNEAFGKNSKKRGKRRAKAREHNAEHMKTRMNRVLDNVDNTKFDYLTIEQTILAYQKILEKDGRRNKKNGPLYQYYIRDFHTDELWTNMDMNVPPSKPWIDSRGKKTTPLRIYILILLNHACLLIPESYPLFERKYKLGRMHESELIEKPRQQKDEKQLDIHTLDIETFVKEGEQTAFMIGHYDGHCYVSMTLEVIPNVVKEFLICLVLRIVDSKRNVLIFAHNGGKFDFYIMLKALMEMPILRYEHSIIRGPRVYRIVFSYFDKETPHRRKQIIFQDSFTLIPMSLNAAGKSFNTEVKKIEFTDPEETNEKLKNFNWSHINENNYMEYIPLLDKYLENDCICLYQVMVKFKEWIAKEIGIDITHCCSLSAISKKLFLTKFYNPVTMPIHSPEEYLYSKLKKAYCGGRCDCFEKPEEKKDVYYYDFNSLYPAAMLNDMPIGTPTYHDTLPREFNLNTFYGFLKIRITATQGTSVGFLPVKAKTGLFFPIITDDDPVTGWYFSEELKAFKTFYTWTPLKGIEYRRGKLFTELIESLYKGKEDSTRLGDVVKRLIIKLLLNCSYGWTGLKKEPSVTIERDSVVIPIKIAHKKLVLEQSGWFVNHMPRMKMGKLDGNYWLRKHYKPSKTSNVGLAAAITAWARIMLNTMLLDIKAVGGEVYYCDTDSAFTNICLEQHPTLSAKYFDPLNAEKIGMLKNELGPGNKALKAIFIGPKFYAYQSEKGDIIKLRGFPQKNYDVKIFDAKNRKIIFSNPSQNGNQRVTYEDMVLLSQGFQLMEQRNEFKVSLNLWFSDFSTVTVREKQLQYVTQNKKMENDEETGKLKSVSSGTLFERNDLKRRKKKEEINLPDSIFETESLQTSEDENENDQEENNNNIDYPQPDFGDEN